MRASLDDVGMAIAAAWASRGTCGRRQVGCALFDATGHLLSTGYNGPASGQFNCTDVPCKGRDQPSGEGLSLCEAIHAEANALLRCSDVTKVHTCYVTHSPCMDCVKLLLNTGCKRVVYGEAYAHDAPARERWQTGEVSWRDSFWPREWVKHGDKALQRSTFVHGHCQCPTPMSCSFAHRCVKGYSHAQRQNLLREPDCAPAGREEE